MPSQEIEVLVVDADGSSGVQIADELQPSGRQVYLAVGPHDRPPRSYRGRDDGKPQNSTKGAGSDEPTNTGV